ncbi:PTS sugar transporter subunit IIA [Schleiferilactobacillus harbinensis]|uniref:PTS sugar transporter subunit IIA n=1 Tax=Schleiferilactobacillus harbinensis TaxID=304207 RepID=UPI0039E93DF0
MFKKLFGRHKEADNRMYSPVTGTVIPLKNVSDPVFSSGVMGEGFGVTPSDGNILSPVTGTVTMVANTKHALGFTMDNGLEVLIHMGVDTVDLKGKPFTISVKPQDKVSGGQEIATMDLDQIKAAGLDNVVIVVITNSKDKLAKLDVETGDHRAGDFVGTTEVKS